MAGGSGCRGACDVRHRKRARPARDGLGAHLGRVRVGERLGGGCAVGGRCHRRALSRVYCPYVGGAAGGAQGSALRMFRECLSAGLVLAESCGGTGGGGGGDGPRVAAAGTLGLWTEANG